MGGYSCHQIGLGYNNIVADDMRVHGGNNPSSKEPDDWANSDIPF